MSRKGVAVRREIEPDAVYGNELIALMINNVMKNGKKNVARKIVYGAIDILISGIYQKSDSEAAKHLDIKVVKDLNSEDYKKQVTKVFEHIITALAPTVEVRPRRVGGATYQVPVEVPVLRRIKLAMSWLIQSANSRKEKGMVQRLAKEFLAVFEGTGCDSIKKRDDMYRMVKANQAFVHLAA